MKIRDVKVGMVVKTKVAGKLVHVRVISERESPMGRQVRFRVMRVDNGKELPTARTAAVLRNCRSVQTTKNGG